VQCTVQMYGPTRTQYCNGKLKFYCRAGFVNAQGQDVDSHWLLCTHWGHEREACDLCDLCTTLLQGDIVQLGNAHTCAPSSYDAQGAYDMQLQIDHGQTTMQKLDLQVPLINLSYMGELLAGPTLSTLNYEKVFDTCGAIAQYESATAVAAGTVGLIQACDAQVNCLISISITDGSDLDVTMQDVVCASVDGKCEGVCPHLSPLLNQISLHFHVGVLQFRTTQQLYCISMNGT